MAYYLFRMGIAHFNAVEGEVVLNKDGWWICESADNQTYTDVGVHRGNISSRYVPVPIDGKTFNVLKNNALEIEKMRSMWVATARAVYTNLESQIEKLDDLSGI